MSDTQPAAPWWSRPIGMGLLGLALMVGGWNLSIWNPRTPQSERLDELRRMAREGNDKELAERLEETARNVHRPPYEKPGRVAIFVGLALFVMAGVRMYRSPAPPEEPLSSEEPQHEERETA